LIGSKIRELIKINQEVYDLSNKALIELEKDASTIDLVKLREIIEAMNEHAINH